MRLLPIRHRDLLPLALTACGVIAGPALFGAPGATPDLPLAIVAIVLTAMIVGFAPLPLHRTPLAGVPVRAGHRRPRAPGWVSP
jgi:hypothetical protein